MCFAIFSWRVSAKHPVVFKEGGVNVVGECYDIYSTSAAFFSGILFCPLLRYKIGDIPVCAFGDAGEHVAQISIRIDAPSPTTLDNFVGDGIELSWLGVSKKQPVLPADSRRPNRILHSIVIDVPLFDHPLGSLRLAYCIADIFGERFPVRDGLAVDGLAKKERPRPPPIHIQGDMTMCHENVTKSEL